MFHLRQYVPNSTEFHQSRQKMRSGKRVSSAQQLSQLCRKPKNPRMRKSMDGSISLSTLVMNSIRVRFLPRFSMTGLQHRVWTMKAKISVKFTVVEADSEVDEVDESLGHGSVGSEDVRVSIDECGSHEEIAVPPDFSLQVTKIECRRFSVEIFLLKDLWRKVLELILCAIQQLVPQIAMRLHHHSCSFDHDDDAAPKSRLELLDEYCGDAEEGDLVDSVDANPRPPVPVVFDDSVDDENDCVVETGQNPPADEGLIKFMEVAVEGGEIQEGASVVDIVHDEHDCERDEARCHHVVYGFVVVDFHEGSQERLAVRVLLLEASFGILIHLLDPLQCWSCAQCCFDFPVELPQTLTYRFPQMRLGLQYLAVRLKLW